jgi:hypothetical protein
VLAPTLLNGNVPVPAIAVAVAQEFEPWAKAEEASRKEATAKEMVRRLVKLIGGILGGEGEGCGHVAAGARRRTLRAH